jgi:hypothetical protein
MSEDEGVTPFEVAGNATPQEVTPGEGKGALGAWWVSCDGSGKGHRAHKPVAHSDTESEIKPVAPGVYVGQRLSFGVAGKGL